MAELPSHTQVINSDQPYNDAFFDAQSQLSLDSARVIVPMVVELFRPKSVIDIGCGLGTWAKAFIENGIEDVTGFDGDYVNREKLLIPASRFVPTDIGRNLIIPRRTDLAVCLEVAEHLPLRSGEFLIETLTTSAPIVLFSAAVPGQGGVHHINEQWPSYWRQLFDKRGYRRIDPFRRRILHNNKVAWWYRQNIFAFVSEGTVRENARVKEELEALECGDFEIVNTSVFARYTSTMERARSLPREIWQSVRRRLAERS